MTKFYWRKEQEERLIKIYPNTLTQDIADEFGCRISSVRNKACALGLKKDPKWIAETARDRFVNNPNHPGRNYVFKKGHQPANKGKKQTDYMTPEAIDKTKATRFKKGNKPANTKNGTGHVSIRYDSHKTPYKFIKLADGEWVMLSTYLWEQDYGKIPKKHIICFKDGDTLNCELENLECIKKAENLRRNNYNRRKEWDKEMAKRAVQHQIKKNKTL